MVSPRHILSSIVLTVALIVTVLYIGIAKATIVGSIPNTTTGAWIITQNTYVDNEALTVTNITFRGNYILEIRNSIINVTGPISVPYAGAKLLLDNVTMYIYGEAGFNYAYFSANNSKIYLHESIGTPEAVCVNTTFYGVNNTYSPYIIFRVKIYLVNVKFLPALGTSTSLYVSIAPKTLLYMRNVLLENYTKPASIFPHYIAMYIYGDLFGSYTVNFTIINLTIKNTFNTALEIQDVSPEKIPNLRIENITILYYGTSGNGFGLYLYNVNNTVIRNLTIKATPTVAEFGRHQLVRLDYFKNITFFGCLLETGRRLNSPHFIFTFEKPYVNFTIQNVARRLLINLVNCRIIGNPDNVFGEGQNAYNTTVTYCDDLVESPLLVCRNCRVYFYTRVDLQYSNRHYVFINSVLYGAFIHGIVIGNGTLVLINTTFGDVRKPHGMFPVAGVYWPWLDYYPWGPVNQLNKQFGRVIWVWNGTGWNVNLTTSSHIYVNGKRVNVYSRFVRAWRLPYAIVVWLYAPVGNTTCFNYTTPWSRIYAVDVLSGKVIKSDLPGRGLLCLTHNTTDIIVALTPDPRSITAYIYNVSTNLSGYTIYLTDETYGREKVRWFNGFPAPLLRFVNGTFFAEGRDHLVNNTWIVFARPYYNNTGWVPVDKNATILGTWISGTVSDLANFDNVWMKFQSYNDTNVMKILLTFNVTTLGWLGADLSKIRIKDIIVKIAGNLSKTVNTKASLEVYNWTSGQWITIDASALNQTVDTEKTYSLANIIGGDLRDLISPSGVIAFRINITDVQTYPSTYVYLTLDELKVLVDYVNSSLAQYVAYVTFNVTPGSIAHISNVELYARGKGDATLNITIYRGNTRIVEKIVTPTATWSRIEIPLNLNLTSNENLTVWLNVTVRSTLSSESYVMFRNLTIYFTESIPTRLFVFCPSETYSVYSRKMYRKCIFVVPQLWYFMHDPERSNITMSIDLPSYLTAKVVAVQPLRKLVVAYGNGNVEISGATTLLRTWIYAYENMKPRLDRSGRLHLTVSSPIGTESVINVTAPTPYLYAILDNGTVVTSSKKYIVVVIKHNRHVLRNVTVYYGLYINRTLYVWVNLTNPTAEIRNIRFGDNVLSAIVKLTGIGEFNVYTLKLPTEVLVDGVHAVREPDRLSYLACTPPCYWYDPIEHILHVKIRGHSPVTVVVDWTGPTQVTKHPEVRSVGLTFNSTTVPVNRPVQYTVNVELYNAWSGVLTYTLTCTGPRTVSITGKITVTDGRGTVTGYVTFSKAGTYACTVKILDTYSPTVYVKVISHKAPFMAHTFTAYALLLLLVVAIVVIVIFIVEKKRRSGSGGEIVVRLNI